MNIQALHIGMRVRHPQYGVGMVKQLDEATASIQFDEGQRTVSGVKPYLFGCDLTFVGLLNDWPVPRKMRVSSLALCIT